MENEKLNAVRDLLISTGKEVTLNSLRLEALESVLKLNFPEIEAQYQLELYKLLNSYLEEHPNFAPPNFSGE